jgi:predicted nucleic acid-binding protein
VSLVIDSSVTLAWYFEDEKTSASLAVLNRVVEEGAVVPALWHLEVLNGLRVAVRRGRITAAYRDASLADLRALVIAIDPGTNEHAWSATLRLCERFRLTAYAGWRTDPRGAGRERTAGGHAIRGARMMDGNALMVMPSNAAALPVPAPIAAAARPGARGYPGARVVPRHAPRRALGRVGHQSAHGAAVRSGSEGGRRPRRVSRHIAPHVAQRRTQKKWAPNAKVGRSDYERASAGTRGNDEDAPIPNSRGARSNRWARR